jgi:ATP-binding cassette, subfamily B, bacterial PglK
MKSRYKYLCEILFLLDEDRKKIPGLILLFIASSTLDLAGLSLIGPYIVLLVNPENIFEISVFKTMGLTESSFEINTLFIILGFSLITIFLFKSIAGILINRKIIRFSNKQQVRLRAELMQTYQNLSYVDYLNRNSSEYIHTMQAKVGNFSGGVVQNLLRISSEGIVVLVILLFLASTNGTALVALLIVMGGVTLLYDRHFKTNLKVYGKIANESSRQMMQGISEGIKGLKEIRILGKSFFFQQMVINGAKNLCESRIKTQVISQAPRYIVEFVIVSFVVIFSFVSFNVTSGSTSTIPTLGIFSIASLRLLPSVNLFIRCIIDFRVNRYATTIIYNDLIVSQRVDYQKPINFSEKPKEAPFSEISFKNVNFCYPNAKRDAIKNINLTIKSGESVGFIGPSGSGKTTLVDVILGLFEPQEGEILYNGLELKSEISNWRAKVAYLPQEIFLIDNSLRCNIAFGFNDKRIDDLNLHNALKQARLSELVDELPQGLNTIIGEHGVRLSGGQRQRVSLARAFYHGRDVLVMDESTSSLDYETEKEIVKEIKRLKGQKTLIVVAHRLSTVRHCDWIYQLREGRIVNQGPPEEIL